MRNVVVQETYYRALNWQDGEIPKFANVIFHVFRETPKDSGTTMNEGAHMENTASLADRQPQ